MAHKHEASSSGEILGTLYVVSPGTPMPDDGTAASLSQAAFQAGQRVEATKTRHYLYERTVYRRAGEHANDEVYTDRKIGFIDLNGLGVLSPGPFASQGYGG